MWTLIRSFYSQRSQLLIYLRKNIYLLSFWPDCASISSYIAKLGWLYPVSKGVDGPGCIEILTVHMVLWHQMTVTHARCRTAKLLH